MIPALIVPVLNRPDLLYRMLASIDHDVDHLLVVDNGRCVTHGQVLKSTERATSVTVLRLPTNLGVPVSWNLGIKALPFAPWWLIVNSDAYFPSGSLARFAAEARTDALVLSGGFPPWCAFAIGDQVIAKVGLFDEALHPAYFEDDDMHRRCDHHGVPVVRSGIPVHHDNSSTIREGKYAQANVHTFAANADYYAAKAMRGDMSAGEWSLARRRDLSWD